MQEEFAKAVKKRNYKLASVGKGKNSSIVISESDIFSEVDTHSFEEVCHWLEENNIHIDAAGSLAGGGAIPTLQKLNNRYNLPTKIPSDLIVGMSKFDQAKIYEKYNLTTIRSWCVDDFPAFQDKYDRFVVKPAIGRGSVGVEFLDKDELTQRIKGGLIHKDYIIQSFQTGIEYRMMVFVQDGQIKILAPIMRESYAGTTYLGRLSCDTHHISRITDYCEKMIKNMNLVNTVIKFDILVSDKSIDMIEMDISVGGGIYFQQYIGELFECDIINRYLDLIVDIKFDKQKLKHDDFVMDYIYNETGAPLNLQKDLLEAYLIHKCGDQTKVIYNKLKSWKTAKNSSNADFTVAVIHKNKSLKNSELSHMVNNDLFNKWMLD